MHTRDALFTEMSNRKICSWGRNDEILLSDFGLVLEEQSTSSQVTREAAGILSYMAPEQLQGKPRVASDQYSLGIVVYEWLCGERPFLGNLMELMGQHALTPPPPLHLRVPTIPPAVRVALAGDDGTVHV